MHCYIYFVASKIWDWNSTFRRFDRSAENITIVSESVAEDMNVSIPPRSQELGLSYGTLWGILNFHKGVDIRTHEFT